MESYLKKEGMKWSDVKMGLSEEKFRFGPGKEIYPKLKKCELLFNISDVEGKKLMFTLKVFIIEAQVPLLLGKDAHKFLNIRVSPQESKGKVELKKK